jgi:hypothetical protein
MGIIAPAQSETKKIKTSSKRLISDALRSQLLEEVAVPDQDGETVIMPRAQALGMRLMDIALYSKSDKTSATAAKIILESVEGKPAVQTEDINQEIPAVKFILQSGDQKRLEEKASKDISEASRNGVLKVDLGNGEGCEIPVDEEEGE